jgi:tetratricopeptide (TPR) repeat protein
LRARADVDAEPLIMGLLNTALLAFDRGKPGQAESAAREAAELAEHHLDRRHPERMATQTMLAMAYRGGGKHALSRDAADRALAGFQVLYGNQPHPRRSEALVLRGRARAELGELDDGVRDILTAVQELEQVLEPGNLSAAVMRQNALPHLLDLGRLVEADALGTRALEGVAAHMPPESYARAGTAASLGAVRVARHRFAEALLLLEPAVVTLGRVLPAGHALRLDAETWRALALVGAGRLDAARSQLDALQPQRGTVDTPAYLRLRIVRAQAALYLAAGDAAQAVAVLAPALEPAVATARAERERLRGRTLLGQALWTAGRHDEAARAWATALADAERLEREATPMRAETLAGLAETDLASGHPDAARARLQQAAAVWRVHAPDAAPARAVQARLDQLEVAPAD